MRKLGEILCKMAGLTQFQLKQALEEQREQKERSHQLGQILVEHGYITEEQLKEALVIQKKETGKVALSQR
jgi:hypothetical protein